MVYSYLPCPTLYEFYLHLLSFTHIILYIHLVAAQEALGNLHEQENHTKLKWLSICVKTENMMTL